jgi:hypothetical protein
MAQPPEMRVWLPWSELVGGPRITREEFLFALRQFPRSALLIACARLSILFDFGPEANTVASKDTTLRFSPLMFQPHLLPRIQVAIEQGRPIFFQGQLRCLAAEVLRLDPAHGENGKEVPDVMLGGLLLGAGELLYRQHVSVTEDLDAMANLVADFLPISEIDSLNDGIVLFLRFYIFLTVIIPRLPKHLATFNVWELFEREFGFPLKLYYLFVYAFTMHAMAERENRRPDDPPPHGGLSISWFRNTVLSHDQVSVMFDTVSCELKDLPDKKRVHGYADFEFLKDNPYFRQADVLYCMDYEFAVAKLESGVLWRIAKGMSKADRLRYFGFWGEVFEEYVAWIFEVYAERSQNTFFRSPAYEIGGVKYPLCDAIVMCGSTAVLIEAKLGTCPADVRYSGDYMKFKEFLEDRLVTGTDRLIGVAQLVRAVENVTTLPPASLPEWLVGVNRIIPLLITKDDIGSGFVITKYLNARFKQRLGSRFKASPIPELIANGGVTPLVSMSASTLERAVAALSKMSLSEILEDRIKEDPLLGRPFEAASSFVFRGTPRGVFEHVEIMKELTRILQDEFGMVDE